MKTPALSASRWPHPVGLAENVCPAPVSSLSRLPPHIGLERRTCPAVAGITPEHPDSASVPSPPPSQLRPVFRRRKAPTPGWHSRPVRKDQLPGPSSIHEWLRRICHEEPERKTRTVHDRTLPSMKALCLSGTRAPPPSIRNG